ncbi:hypothetical protein YC2023_017543 [Brassica napus]
MSITGPVHNRSKPRERDGPNPRERRPRLGERERDWRPRKPDDDPHIILKPLTRRIRQRKQFVDLISDAPSRSSTIHVAIKHQDSEIKDSTHHNTSIWLYSIKLLCESINLIINPTTKYLGVESEFRYLKIRGEYGSSSGYKASNEYSCPTLEGGVKHFQQAPSSFIGSTLKIKGRRGDSPIVTSNFFS